VLTAWLPAAFGDENLVVYFDPFRADDADLTRQEWELGLRYGCVTRNEYRKSILDQPPIDGGDVPLIPATMVPA
jgi:hypothetical protein